MSRHDSSFSDATGPAPRAAYTALVKRDGPWLIGWIEEIPGVNCQEATQPELIESLRDALREMLEMNRQDARAAVGSGFSEIAIAL